jgi:hypothetical protein
MFYFLCLGEYLNLTEIKSEKNWEMSHKNEFYINDFHFLENNPGWRKYLAYG